MCQRNNPATLLGVILLLALAVRIWGLGHDLPYVYHPDEPFNLTVSQKIFATGDLNPHTFNYPSLFFYLNSLLHVPYYLIGKLQGVFASPADLAPPITLAMGVTAAPFPSLVFLARFMTVILGVGTVGLLFVIGRRLTGNPNVGLLAALFAAVSPINVAHSRFIAPDTYAAFFATLSFLATVVVYQQGKTRHYLLAGLAIGLTAASKYNGGLILLPLILVHFLRHGKAAFKERDIYLAGLVCGLTFLATTPYALLDYQQFLAHLKRESQHYATGHAGMEGNALWWYLKHMWQTAIVVYVLAALEILRGLRSRSKETILLSVFPVIYFVFICSFVVRNERTFLPLTPFLFLLAASFLGHLFVKGNEKQLCKWVAIGLAVLGLGSEGWTVVSNTARETRTNSRETARVWIDENVPAGSRVVIESYAPFVDPVEYAVQGTWRIIDYPPDWYAANGFDYVVFSQGMYGRYYDEPDRYQTEIAKYELFFDRFKEVRRFNDGDYEIRIHATK